jgi:cell division protein FtsX
VNFLILFTIALLVALFVLLSLAIWLAKELSKSLSREVQLKKDILTYIDQRQRCEWPHSKICDHFKLNEWGHL